MIKFKLKWTKFLNIFLSKVKYYKKTTQPFEKSLWSSGSVTPSKRCCLFEYLNQLVMATLAQPVA